MTFEEVKSILMRAKRVAPYQTFKDSGFETQWYLDGKEIATGFVDELIVKYFNNGSTHIFEEPTHIFKGNEAAELLMCGTLATWSEID